MPSAPVHSLRKHADIRGITLNSGEDLGNLARTTRWCPLSYLIIWFDRPEFGHNFHRDRWETFTDIYFKAEGSAWGAAIGSRLRIPADDDRLGDVLDDSTGPNSMLLDAGVRDPPDPAGVDVTVTVCEGC